MGYSTDTAIWPTATPPSTVQLFDLLFTLVDTKSETTGERLAEEVFKSDGIFMATSGSFQGHDGTCCTLKSASPNTNAININESSHPELSQRSVEHSRVTTS